MNLSHLFEHWSITENPFKGEEARDDSVFARLGLPDDETDAPAGPASSHSDFEKVLGSLERPSTAVVFGEKGSGKTAIRMQMADQIRRYNLEHPDRGVWVIAYDDLNAILDSVHEHAGKSDPLASLKTMRLVDHMDAMLGRSTTTIISQLLDSPLAETPSPVPEDAARRLRKAGPGVIRDLRVLQAAYDDTELAPSRARALRRKFRIMPDWRSMVLLALAWGGWVVPAVFVALAFFRVADDAEKLRMALLIVAGILGAGWLGVAGWQFGLERWRLARLGHRLSKQNRASRRGEQSFAGAVAQLDRADQTPHILPLTDSDETRYEMLDRLRRVLAALGYGGVFVLMDRVDEPTLVNGDAERMRAIVWPMFNNKFLQQQGFAIKMLLPIELRYALFKESSAFFQEARLDKQNLVERLSWTGSMLYDLCDARLKACRPADADPMSLMDLFTEDVNTRDVVDALDQMHQPRDAFKLLYHCLSEHCSNVTADQKEWRIPRLVLEQVRKQEADRVQQLYRGIRPA